MYGAIIGDIIGSRFEFDRGGKTKDFRLFTKHNHFTDDTVLTVAVADALLYSGKDADIDTIKENVKNSMVHWAKKYPRAGYGGRFYQWLHTKDKKPYGSYGNGSAMRVSSAGWLYDSLDRTSEVARATAEVTHNHPEGVKGATCTAEVIYLARTENTKEKIKEYVIKHYDYDINTTLDELRKKHRHDESCQDSMPKALVSFFEGDSYEDVVRNAVSLGGDTDTLAAIAGAMAEAYYGIPVELVAQSADYIPADLQKVINRLYGLSEETESPYRDNIFIKQAIDEIYQEYNIDSLDLLLQVILKRIEDQGTAPTPMVNVNNVQLDISNLNIGDSFTLNDDLRLKVDTMTDQDGKLWIPLFTDEEEIHKGETTNILLETSIDFLIGSAYSNPEVQGLVINPFGKSFAMPKDLIKIILDHSSPTNGNE